MTVNTQSTVLEQEAAFAAQQATRSLLYEVSVSPKPGLVDRFDSGAHADMDFFTYLDSSVALTEYFRMAYLEGASSPCLTPPELFPRLRRLGVQAEQQMYAATRGVNTHKGIIFTLGLFCGGLGWLSGRDESADEVGLLHLCSQIVTPEFEQELRKIPLTSAKSGGERFLLPPAIPVFGARRPPGTPALFTVDFLPFGVLCNKDILSMMPVSLSCWNCCAVSTIPISSCAAGRRSSTNWLRQPEKSWMRSSWILGG